MDFLFINERTASNNQMEALFENHICDNIDLQQPPDLRLFRTKCSFDEQDFLAKAKTYLRHGWHTVSFSQQHESWVKLARDWLRRGFESSAQDDVIFMSRL